MRLVVTRIPSVYSGYVTVGSKIYQAHHKHAEFVFCIKHFANAQHEVLLTKKEATVLLKELEQFINTAD